MNNLARAIHMIIDIKLELIADNDLALKLTGCGKIAAARILDDLIKTVLEIETAYASAREELVYIRKENVEYGELFEDFTPDMLSDEEKAQLRALVAEWRQVDEEREER